MNARRIPFSLVTLVSVACLGLSACGLGSSSENSSTADSTALSSSDSLDSGAPSTGAYELSPPSPTLGRTSSILSDPDSELPEPTDRAINPTRAAEPVLESLSSPTVSPSANPSLNPPAAPSASPAPLPSLGTDSGVCDSLRATVAPQDSSFSYRGTAGDELRYVYMFKDGRAEEHIATLQGPDIVIPAGPDRQALNAIGLSVLVDGNSSTTPTCILPVNS